LFSTARHLSLSQMTLVHALTTYSFKINFNIIIPSMPKSFCLLPFSYTHISSSSPYSLTAYVLPLSNING
jgi:hypothetical protein